MLSFLVVVQLLTLYDIHVPLYIIVWIYHFIPDVHYGVNKNIR